MAEPIHIHLQPVGGIAGDMFVAAMLDAFPDLLDGVTADLNAIDLPDAVTWDLRRQDVNGLQANYFQVAMGANEIQPSGTYREIRARLNNANLDDRVRAPALSIFRILAEAEAAIHGVDPDKVHFHEIADWDSLADIVAAASLIGRIGPALWTCASLPLGGGTVTTAHGTLPLPAPATLKILNGFAWHDDGQAGERVTPTGAAILRHLMDDNMMAPEAGRLAAMGTGCGTARFAGLANILRVSVFEADVPPQEETIIELAFEIDDMTPEEVAVALDHLRAADGVLDAAHGIRYGKKGRLQFAVTLLVTPQAKDPVLDACFTETTTLGIRWRQTRRRILDRSRHESKAGGRRIGVKLARRPDNRLTGKAESDDLAEFDGLRRRRDVAGSAVSSVLAGKSADPDRDTT